MTEKRFHYNIDEVGIYYYICDGGKTEDKIFAEVIGDVEEVTNKLNELAEENKLHKERISLLSSLLDLADIIIDTSDNEKAKQVWNNKNEQTEKEWEKILND